MGEEVIKHCVGQVNASENRITMLKEELRVEEQKTLPHWLEQLYLARNGGEELRN